MSAALRVVRAWTHDVSDDAAGRYATWHMVGACGSVAYVVCETLATPRAGRAWALCVMRRGHRGRLSRTLYATRGEAMDAAEWRDWRRAVARAGGVR